MSMNGKGLGRGLDALFQSNPSQGEEMPSSETFQLVSPAALAPNPGQPRENFTEESLAELADSIREKGILQPLLVRPSTQPGTFQIVAGERRWRAAKLAGMEQIPVMVQTLDDNEAMIVALIENIQREDLNPIELAKGLVALKDALGINQDMLAARLGKQKWTISNQIRLLRLSQEAQDELVRGNISQGHARALLGITATDAANALLERILSHNLTVREAEEETSFWKENNRFSWEKTESEKTALQQDPAFRQLATRIGETLNCPAKINGNIEKGRISLNYESSEQLYQLLEKLGLSLESVIDQN